jgi:hypothetical protein
MKLVDYDPFYGISTYYKTQDGKGILTEVQDVEPFFDVNKRIGEGLNKKSNFWLVGEIPMNICYKWSVECGHKMFSKDWQEYARKQLKHPDYRKFNQANIKL